MPSAPALSVILPAHNPQRDRLRRTLLGLRGQTLPPDRWETLVVDNASSPALDAAELREQAPANFQLLTEAVPGLSQARRRGFTAARAGLAVLVDDDNVLAPDYLAAVLAHFSAQPKLGALGGKSQPEFAAAPPAWIKEFYSLLALRDLGEKPLLSSGLRPDGSTRLDYPPFAPIGAGMGLRRAAWQAWLDARRDRPDLISDRRGGELSSAGDNDIVCCVLRAGWDVGYFPDLALTHLIPPARTDAAYLARLNRGIQKSWMQVLTLHGANPWPALTPLGATLRKINSWFTHQAGISRPARIRWQGACGHFDGRVATRPLTK